VAWDFSTEPEFERKLEWMREFVRTQVWPRFGQVKLGLMQEILGSSPSRR
jgi:hypothetical protein